MQAVSARSTRGPSETGDNKGMREQRFKLRRRKPTFRSDQQCSSATPAGIGGASLRSTAAKSCRPAGQSAQHCRQRPRLMQHRHSQPFTLLGRFHGDGVQSAGIHPVRVAALCDDRSSAETPSSVAFCTTRSVASRFSSANSSHRSGSSGLRPRQPFHTQVRALPPQQSRCGPRTRHRGR